MIIFEMYTGNGDNIPVSKGNDGLEECTDIIPICTAIVSIKLYDIIETNITIKIKLVPHLGCSFGKALAFSIFNLFPDSKLYTVLCSAP